MDSKAKKNHHQSADHPDEQQELQWMVDPSTETLVLQNPGLSEMEKRRRQAIPRADVRQMNLTRRSSSL